MGRTKPTCFVNSLTKVLPDTNIGVDLKLVSGDVLLRATLAGIGPDVAINVDSTLPVNYALRKLFMILVSS